MCTAVEYVMPWMDEECLDGEGRSLIVNELRDQAQRIVNRYHGGMLVVGGMLVGAVGFTGWQPGNRLCTMMHVLGTVTAMHAHYQHRRLRIPLMALWSVGTVGIRYAWGGFEWHHLVFDVASLLYGWIASTDQVSFEAELEQLDASAKQAH